MSNEQTEAVAIDRAERFAKGVHCTPGEHDDIMVAVRLARKQLATPSPSSCIKPIAAATTWSGSATIGDPATPKVDSAFSISRRRHEEKYTPSPAPSDTRRDALNRMVELDEQIEAANPGWMTGGPARYRAIAAELTEALAKRDTDLFRAIAFRERHHIIAALGGSHD